MSDVHHDITLGRMNPPTAGHAAVVNQVTSHAKGGHTIILTKSHDAKKNPLTPEQKLKYTKKAFPKANIKLTSTESPTMLHHASNLHDQGVTHLHVHVGSDRVSEFSKLLNTYNGKPGPHGYYKFKEISVHPVGDERKDEGSGVESASGTAMRKHASSGNKEGFKKMAPSGLPDKDKENMYDDVRNGMGIKDVRNGMGIKESLSFKSWLKMLS